MTFSWSDDLAAHIFALDKEHCDLMALLGVLEEAILLKRDHQIIECVLMRLANFVQEHFSREEGVMRHVGYPALAEQVQQHQEFVGCLTEIVHQFEIGSDSVSADTAVLMRNWLETHVSQEDAALTQYLRQRLDNPRSSLGEDPARYPQRMVSASAVSTGRMPDPARAESVDR